MLALYMSGAPLRMLAIEIGMCRAINCRLSIDYLSKGRRELLVGSVPTCPKGISPNAWYCVVVEMGYASWLALVNQICMPAGRPSWTTETGRHFRRLKLRPDNGDTGDTRHLGYLRL